MPLIPKVNGAAAAALFEAGLARAAKQMAGRSAAERRILATALGRKLALAVLAKEDVEDALQPAGEVKRDAFVRGAKLGAAAVNRATGAR